MRTPSSLSNQDAHKNKCLRSLGRLETNGTDILTRKLQCEKNEHVQLGKTELLPEQVKAALAAAGR
jgi:hypothetical protein